MNGTLPMKTRMPYTVLRMFNSFIYLKHPKSKSKFTNLLCTLLNEYFYIKKQTNKMLLRLGSLKNVCNIQCIVCDKNFVCLMSRSNNCKQCALIKQILNNNISANLKLVYILVLPNKFK